MHGGSKRYRTGALPFIQLDGYFAGNPADQGTAFMSHVMKDVCSVLQIKQVRASVNHPQTDRLVECFNKILKQMLK